uniref:Uncharacterized protein n=1 Tax=Rhizophora mucronata TaxID=61149 RepID=A0A2P2QS82_RHIMU
MHLTLVFYIEAFLCLYLGFSSMLYNKCMPENLLLGVQCV